jgi:hypothetical protein
MRLKKLGTALVVVLALGAIAVSSASAAAVTEDQTWTIEGVTLSGSESVSSSGAGELKTTVGTTPLKLSEATGINCLSCTISNSGGSAVGSGSLEFTGVTVETPATCAATNVGSTLNGVIRTKALEVKADYMIGTADYILFKPATGTLFAEIELMKGSGGCPISGPYNVTGEVFVKSVNGTGVDEVIQKVESSGTINETASGKTEPLLFGGKKAELIGTASFALSGANKGKKFGTK